MAKYYFTIGEVSKKINIKAHVIRYWETQIPMLKPKKILNGIRHYKEDEIKKLILVKDLIQNKGMTTDGVSKFLEDENAFRKKMSWVVKELKEVMAEMSGEE